MHVFSSIRVQYNTHIGLMQGPCASPQVFQTYSKADLQLPWCSGHALVQWGHIQGLHHLDQVSLPWLS